MNVPSALKIGFRTVVLVLLGVILAIELVRLILLARLDAKIGERLQTTAEDLTRER